MPPLQPLQPEPLQPVPLPEPLQALPLPLQPMPLPEPLQPLPLPDPLPLPQPWVSRRRTRRKTANPDAA